MTAPAAPKNTPPKAPDDLPTHFLRLTRGALSGVLTTDWLFDAEKIRAMLADADAAWPEIGVAPLDEAAAERITVMPPDPGPEIAAPTFDDHYVFHRNQRMPRLRLDAFRFRDVRLSFDVSRMGRPEFYLFDREGRLINGMFFGAAPFLEEVEEEIDAPSVLIDDFFIKPNICHFLFDKLPRAFLAESAFGARQALLFHPFGYADEIAAMLGLPLRALAGRPGGQSGAGPRVRGTVRFADLVLLSDSFNGLRHPAQVGSDAHLAVLARIRARIPKDPDGPQARRFMIERAPGLPRNIVNAEETRALAARFGFAFGDPATMSVRAQLQLFAGVEVLMGVHGAGLANLAFQPDGGSVVELHAPLCGTHAYWYMARLRGLGYESVTCQDPEFGTVDYRTVQHNAAHNRRDVVVPLDRLEEALSRVC
ncbi:glycosyltransferase family 61 protein [Marinibacterium profundimaris]|uniref:Glycosyltransferase 61 catalytic domain-containing protein n=1 Tax=Marinibacterium profundimaris TaxID=1679460 RepID=A0A225NCL3_9RHOB|nr:glycosyltransferase family 61 protein [Marinibacterium profundimaris]OWU68412.1 hypothetical protein ATO3_24335 [Marinibacterium profundimaris]